MLRGPKFDQAARLYNIFLDCMGARGGRAGGREAC